MREWGEKQEYYTALSYHHQQGRQTNSCTHLGFKLDYEVYSFTGVSSIDRYLNIFFPSLQIFPMQLDCEVSLKWIPLLMRVRKT